MKQCVLSYLLHPTGTVSNASITRVREEDGGEGLEGAVVAGLPEPRVVAPQKVQRAHEFFLGGLRPQIQVRVQQPYALLVVAPIAFQDLR